MQKLRSITIMLSLLISSVLSAQITQQRLLDDPKCGAGIYRPYFSDRGQNYSNPLKGFKPFYISHFGRHGSRYFSRPKNMIPPIEAFEAAKAEGLLTPKGDSLYSAIKAVYLEHQDMYGELVPLGGREHRGIASRMYEREKPVFTSKDRTRVRCVSSVFTRCLVSMANFTEELSSHAPALDMNYTAGKRYNKAYVSADIPEDYKNDAVPVIDSLKAATFHPEKLFSLYFTDPQRVMEMVPDHYAFEMGLYYFWAICYDLDFLGQDITRFIPVEELYACATVGNAYRYSHVGISDEFGEFTRVKGEKLLKDMLEKAEDALSSGSDVAADLRFIHDSGFVPLCTLLGLDGFPEFSFVRAHREWNPADVVPMCANLQIVFYRNRKGEVVVKLLVNEKESAVKGLTPVTGPYYRWSDLKQMIEK